MIYQWKLNIILVHIRNLIFSLQQISKVIHDSKEDLNTKGVAKKTKNTFCTAITECIN